MTLILTVAAIERVMISVTTITVIHDQWLQNTVIHNNAYWNKTITTQRPIGSPHTGLLITPTFMCHDCTFVAIFVAAVSIKPCDGYGGLVCIVKFSSQTRAACGTDPISVWTANRTKGSLTHIVLWQVKGYRAGDEFNIFFWLKLLNFEFV